MTRPRLIDVAREAGVSVGAASNALSGTNRIPDATRRRVKEVADRLGYVRRIARRGRRLTIRELEARLEGLGVVPVVSLVRPADALTLASGLLAGGLPVAEITFRTDAAAEGIALLRRRHPSLLVGAGTVLTADQVDAAFEAGAHFLVAPGFNPAIVERAAVRGIPIVPGVATPTEIEMALALGVRFAKLFPAGPLGGVDYLRALAGPYPMMRLLPTGGIDAGNLAAHLALPTVVACGGSWIAPREVLVAGNARDVERAAREAVAIVASARPR